MLRSRGAISKTGLENYAVFAGEVPLACTARQAATSGRTAGGRTPGPCMLCNGSPPGFVEEELLASSLSRILVPRVLALRVVALLAIVPALALTACNRADKPPAPPPSEAAGTTWLNEGVVLYLPDHIMKARIRIEDLSPYMKSVDAAARTVIQAQKNQAGTSGMLLVALRPQGQSKAWIVTGEPPMAQNVADAVVAATEAVPAAPVSEETVLVGIKFHAFGGGTAPVSAGPPIPRDWYSHFTEHGGLLDDALLEKVWPKEVQP